MFSSKLLLIYCYTTTSTTKNVLRPGIMFYSKHTRHKSLLDKFKVNIYIRAIKCICLLLIMQKQERPQVEGMEKREEV